MLTLYYFLTLIYCFNFDVGKLFTSAQVSEVKIEIVDKDRNSLPSFVEVYEGATLLASFDSQGEEILLSMPKSSYDFILFHCGEKYEFEANIYRKHHHVVVVLEEKPCDEKIVVEQNMLL